VPLFGKAQPDQQQVDKLTYCLRQIVETPFDVDDRIPTHLMPANAKLKPKVFVKNWKRAPDNPSVYSGVVERGDRPPRQGEAYRWVPPGIVLGAVWIGWPGEPTDEALAFKVGEWLLILEGRQKANFDIGRGPDFAGVPSVHFQTSHNGFGACTMALIYDPTLSAFEHDPPVQQVYAEPRPVDVGAATRAEVEPAGTTEQYQEAVMNAALVFAESVQKEGGPRMKAKWLAEREVNALYLGALEAWMQRLSDDDIDWLMSEMCAYLGAGALPEDKIDDENLMQQSTVEMEELLKARVADYGDLLLITPLTSSAELRKAFSQRVRAEVGGSADVERAAARLFDELPDLKPQLVAQRFLRD
jgi:hypothetical protein